jgi:plasmid stability protein
MRISTGLAVLMLGAVFPLIGQSRQNGGVIMLEESYLQESIELMLIKEQSEAPSRDLKESALRTIDAALKQGSKDRVIFVALQTLALEGSVNKTMEAGVVVNNYPDLRVKAARYLGILGGAEAQTVLRKMLAIELEPMILTEVVTALGTIGLNSKGETVTLISKKLKSLGFVYPDNRLTLASLEVYEKFAAQAGWNLDAETEEVLTNVAYGRYHATVRSRARQLLAKLSVYQQ